MDTPEPNAPQPGSLVFTISGKPPKIAKEVAEDEFLRLCAARHVETDESDWTESDKASFAVIRGHIVKLLCSGRLTVNVDGNPSYVALSGKGFTFGKATGAALISMDGKDSTARMFAAFAEMSGNPVNEFGKLELADVNHLSSLYSLFFQRASSI